MSKKLGGVLSYIGILFIIPLIAAKDDADIKFHVNQGLVLFLVGVIGGFICGFIPMIGGYISMALSIFTFVLMIIGIINASKEETKPLPIIGGITILK